METIRDMRIRLKSITSTKQITESMRLISTSKVQKNKNRMEANRPYYEQAVKIIDGIANDPQFRFMKHPYIVGNKNVWTNKADNDDKTDKSLIILITGDRGLCGSYNVNAEKEAYALMKKLGDSQIITIGAKGRDYFRRRQKTVLQSFKGMSENPFFKDAQSIGTTAIKMYDETEVNQVYLVYTEYHSMLSQTPKSIRLLPLDKLYKTAKNGEIIESEAGVMSYDSEKEKFLKNAVSAYIFSVIYGSMLESSVCEQCARITGMDSAVKNSDKIIDTLTLQYNQMRQSLITQEIAEIVGGANTFGEKKN